MYGQQLLWDWESSNISTTVNISAVVFGWLTDILFGIVYDVKDCRKYFGLLSVYIKYQRNCERLAQIPLVLVVFHFVLFKYLPWLQIIFYEKDVEKTNTGD